MNWRVVKNDVLLRALLRAHTPRPGRSAARHSIPIDVTVAESRRVLSGAIPFPPRGGFLIQFDFNKGVVTSTVGRSFSTLRRVKDQPDFELVKTDDV